jgi:hypothetical protein
MYKHCSKCGRTMWLVGGSRAELWYCDNKQCPRYKVSTRKPKRKEKPRG